MNHSELGRPIEILLVEDNPGDAELTAEALRHGKVYNQMHVVEDGEAALALFSPAGRVVMCLNAGAGSVLGLPAVVGGEPYSLTATIRKDSAVKFVSRADFEALIQDEPWLYPSVLQVLAAEVRSARLALATR